MTLEWGHEPPGLPPVAGRRAALFSSDTVAKIDAILETQMPQL